MGWLKTIDPDKFNTDLVESFFSKWDLGKNPAISTESLYEFSGTPSETHAAAMKVTTNWIAPDAPAPREESEVPKLSSFTNGLVLP